MASVHDVAAYIIKECGEMTAMKLQKLCYYSQAWHQVWEDRLLFNERIEAWANGPVVPELYRLHRGDFRVSSWVRGDVDMLDEGEKESIDIVIKSYGKFNAYELSEMTHREDPWKRARQGIPDGDRCSAPISLGAMHSYYLGVANRKSDS